MGRGPNFSQGEPADLFLHMQTDTLRFAADMLDRSRPGVPTHVEPESRGGRYNEMPMPLRTMGIWVVRSGTKYGGEELAQRCAEQARTNRPGRFGELRRAGLSLETIFMSVTADAQANQPEERHIAVTQQGQLGLVTDHRHGPAHSQRRLKTHPHHSYFIAGHVDTPKRKRKAYDEWQADLRNAGRKG
jgi:hypothetical protein